MLWELLIPIAVVAGGVMIYNGLVKARVQVDGAWADIDVQLKRRHDLIPNIVETVKGYASHERETLEAVVTARSAAISAEGPARQAEAENVLTGALKSLFAVSEAYPQLQATSNFQNLQETLGEVEHGIQQARRYYNAVVRDYNTRIGQVPTNLLARSFGFTQREFFEIDEEETRAPKVSFD